MKKFLIAATALTAAFAATAGAASAAPYDGRYRDVAYERSNINRQQDNIAMRIDQGQRNGGLTNREARMLRVELNDISRLEVRYRRDGLSRWERNDLDRRLDVLSQRVRFDRRDGDRRGYDGDGRGYDGRGRF